MTAREHMSLPTEFAVCEALTTLVVTGDERSAEAAIIALHELGFGECAAHLDTALALRRELSAGADVHSVRASDLNERIVAYVDMGANGRNPRS